MSQELGTLDLLLFGIRLGFGKSDCRLGSLCLLRIQIPSHLMDISEDSLKGSGYSFSEGPGHLSDLGSNPGW